MQARLHSFQSFSTSDGPGVRCVVFLQGCPLRCMYCHNPDTWDLHGGTEVELEELMDKIRRCKPYFGKHGGVTISGGELLVQAAFCTQLLRRCKEEGIHTCIETSGAMMNDDIREMLTYVDLVYLDVKMTSEAEYRNHIGTSLAKVLSFLSILETMKKKTIVRHVVLEGLNDSKEHIKKLKSLLSMFSIIEEVEFLAFHTLGQQKYEKLGIEDRSKAFKPTTQATIDRCRKWYDEPACAKHLTTTFTTA